MIQRIPITLWLSAMSIVACWTDTCLADNPIVQTKYTADPAPMVYDGTVYLYTSHDEDTAVNFTMYNWMLYTTTDMVNWTDHGIVAGVKAPNNTFPWAAGSNAWAPQAIGKNGKFYLYVPIQGVGRMTIAVGVADSPFGPFKDPLGKALVTTGTSDDIDPTVFIDGDGQAYLYWGNPNCHYVTLNPDMVSYSGSIATTPKIQTYQEGPWFYRRGNNYYLAFASTCCPEGIGYAMSTGPTGPWTFKGSIMDGNTQSSGNHPGIIDYKGNSYVFGFNYDVQLQREGKRIGERRSVAVEKLTYAADGTIPKLPFWSKTGPNQLESLNPYVQTEAETIAWAWDVKTETCSEGGLDVTAIENGDFIKVKGVDFGVGATSLDVRVASGSSGGNIEVRLDSQTGKLVGSCTVSGTGDAQTWTTKSCSISGASGVHDLYFVFTGGAGSLFNLNWWKFHGNSGAIGSATGGATSNGVGAAAGGGGRANGGAGGRNNAGGSGGTTSLVSKGGANAAGGPATGGRNDIGGASSTASGGGGVTGNGGTSHIEAGGSLGAGGVNSSVGAGGSVTAVAVETGGAPIEVGGNRAIRTSVPIPTGGTVGGTPAGSGSGCGCTLPGKNGTRHVWLWSLASLLAACLGQRRARSKPNLGVRRAIYPKQVGCDDMIDIRCTEIGQLFS